MALHLGDLSLAQDMCRLRPDPIQRTIFIDQVASWQGDASRLATFAKTMVDPALRSGISLGIGSTPAEQLNRGGETGVATGSCRLVSTRPGQGSPQRGGLGAPALATAITRDCRLPNSPPKDASGRSTASA